MSDSQYHRDVIQVLKFRITKSDRRRTEIASDEELDLLEIAHGLTDTSRLGCQVDVTNEMEGIVLKVPTETFDARKL